jgi:molybdopterin biosynthesis enzyme MoaB
LPGSSRAVEEYLDEILPTLDHSLRMVAGIDSH